MPVLPEFIPLGKQKEMFAVSSWRDSPQASTPALSNVANQPMSPALLPAAQCEKDVGQQGKGQRTRKSKGRGKNQSSQRQPDVEDFFVNFVLPPGISFANIKEELQLFATTPLHIYDVGPPHTLLVKKSTGAVGNADADVSAASQQADGTAPLIDKGVSKCAAHEQSPIRTPNIMCGVTADCSGEVAGAAMPGISLPPSIPAETLSKGYLISLLFAESSEAEKVSELLKKKWPQSTVTIVPRNRSMLNASLVLKGLPNLPKTEVIIEELDKIIPHKPSYIRLHRGERGVFKNVVFIKYPNREIAEECKLRLERLYIGSRPLKVEFKKKEKPAAEKDEGMTLQQLVRDLRVSSEHEGFRYQRSDLSKEDLKVLKQLCNSYGLSFDLDDRTVTVRRILPLSGRPSPAMRPAAANGCASHTLTATMPTPGTLQPMDFRGIRHWRELNSQQVSLGIARPKEPGSVQPFAPGRGRPL
ncbi:RNA-binding protein, putative [Trypanosoma brucei brucei TREU927]|uniref:RNA-binding protein, putative n=1 Tax=Trypanosoma brucei brucei (strain 927/4 GUTat10.1) TaxID=185431 RepID=Q385I3_TRYB2|nr:uncharacterized protein Tb11.02.3610 [Trypanosoma brucei brucei TREU927]EAN79548.1 RNA-binding protein, putative [Trypanosoma brucei brucei TREU927]